MADIATLIDARAEPPKPRGPYMTKARWTEMATENSN
jgi:hypothetical protein